MSSILCDSLALPSFYIAMSYFFIIDFVGMTRILPTSHFTSELGLF